ncbi:MULTISPECIES: S9 family peptidase [unclassified Sphingomonas]|uniref:alpha/beta hydrolase family protein n=1 Tax=unclassified Sphingomonas TaxID=196159 RepID=UPI000BD9590B|nr:MAG: alpha/beta hydrolase [Sphingomonas sp. 12-62-6]OYX39660.1 MAG: alpha/beta hydrolase [Sphingomonas sp. 32-62-10]
MAQGMPRGGWWLLILGLVLALGGAMLANRIQTAGGVEIRDIRFIGTGGKRMSALLYVPSTATPTSKAPGILAVHGYINSRETQSGFAIEFARRGYVVLALDQTGHGYSQGPSFSNGFGGPDGLAHLRSLPMVDTANIGMEGHSMGGWTVLAAAAAYPDDYKAIVLEGSSTGAPFAKDGSPSWPRNLGLVFSQYDEFSKLMWDVDKARDVVDSPKLKAVFGTSERIVPRKLYGSIADGTARILATPAVTHPGDHISPEAIARAIDWFSVTLKGGKPIPSSEQIWYWKELGTALGLVGFVMIVLGAFDMLVRLPGFSGVRGIVEPVAEARDGRWWRAFAMTSFLPALTFFPVFSGLYLLVQPNPVLPQTVSTQITIWALIGAGISWLIGRGTVSGRQSDWLPSVVLAGLSVGAGYAALAAADQLFHTDFRFWIIAVKLPTVQQLLIALIYVVPITIGFLASVRVLVDRLTVQGDGWVAQYGWAKLALALGFVVMLVLDYGVFFATGQLPTAIDPLSTVIAMQFPVVLAAVAAIAIFTWRRTGSYRPGALIAGLMVTLYVVAGTATQGW